jgi:hypothetical protein
MPMAILFLIYPPTCMFPYNEKKHGLFVVRQEGAMEVFRDLCIRATTEQMAALVGEIEQSLPSGWTRDRVAEGRVPAGTIGHGPIYCFGCQAEGRRPAALVILLEKEVGAFCVSNILPASKHQLAHAEYNSILEEFCERLLRPAAEQAGLSVVLTEADVGLDHWMSSATVEKLRRFSHGANKGIGISCNSDREKWNDFVLSAYKEDSRLDASTLKRWLVEVEGWSPEVAEQLAIEYQSGRALLTYAESHRRSA